MITIHFDFKTREAEDLDQINQLLAVMKLEEMEIETCKGYLATTQDGEGNLIQVRYGVDSGTLVCKRARVGGHTYQIDTVVVDAAAGLEDEEFVDCWRRANPGRTVRTIITAEFGHSLAHIVAHHEKAGLSLADILDEETE